MEYGIKTIIIIIIKNGHSNCTIIVAYKCKCQKYSYNLGFFLNLKIVLNCPKDSEICLIINIISLV